MTFCCILFGCDEEIPLPTVHQRLSQQILKAEFSNTVNIKKWRISNNKLPRRMRTGY